MSPLPVVLQGDETAARAAALFESTRLDALVVVNSDGRLAGVVTTESNLADPSSRLSVVMDTDVTTFNEGTPLAALLEFFTRESRPRAVITYRGHPTGLVTREQLATFNESVTMDRFAPGKPCSNTSDYLVVVDRVLTGNTW
jgi:predicted transcriptional regulator